MSLKLQIFLPSLCIFHALMMRNHQTVLFSECEMNLKSLKIVKKCDNHNIN